jgi:hypothetical protein
MSREVNLGIRDEFSKYGYGGVSGIGIRDEYSKYSYGMGFKDDPYWGRSMGFKDDAYWLGRRMGFKDDAYWLGSYDAFLSEFNAQVTRYNALAQQAAALGYQQGVAFQTMASESIGAGRNPAGGLASAIESIRFDIKHNPGKEDTQTLSAIRVKIDVLAGVVKSMTEQPSAPTQDGENERALEFARSEVDRLAKEKQELLANQISGDFLGVSKKTWMYVGGGVAALALVGLGIRQFA